MGAWEGEEGMILLLWMGCVAPLIGLPSFTMMATADGVPAEPMGSAITVEECSKNVLGFISWADELPSHEGVLAKALKESGADVLLNAELSTYTFNAWVYTKSCTRITGVPARLQRP